MHLPHELTFAETITTSNDHSKVASFIFLEWTLPSNSTKYFTLLFVRSETLDWGSIGSIPRYGIGWVGLVEHSIIVSASNQT